MSGTAEAVEMPLTGGCQCGAVRYAVSRPVTHASVCHCRMCQKASGGPFMAFGRVRLDGLTWTRGQPSLFRSSTVATRGFCPACGTPLTYQFSPDALSLTLGSLDRPDAVTPTLAYERASRLPWAEHIADLATPGDDGLTPQAEAAFVNHQHPDHDT